MTDIVERLREDRYYNPDFNFLAREAADEIERLRAVLTAASHALRSYQYGNRATDLAQDVADKCDAALKEKTHEPG